MVHLTILCLFYCFCDAVTMIIIARNGSCRKVMFSQVCVKNSVHRGGIYPRGVCLGRVCPDPSGSASRRGVCIQGGLPGGLHPGGLHPRGVCIQRGLPRGAVHLVESASKGGLHPGGLGRPPLHQILLDTVNEQRYASYWNAFLYKL